MLNFSLHALILNTDAIVKEHAYAVIDAVVAAKKATAEYF